MYTTRSLMNIAFITLYILNGTRECYRKHQQFRIVLNVLIFKSTHTVQLYIGNFF